MSKTEQASRRLNKGQIAKIYGHSHMWTSGAVATGVLPPPIGGRNGYWTLEYLQQWEQQLIQQNIEIGLQRIRQQGN